MATIEQLRSGQVFEDELFTGLDLNGEDLSGKDFCRCVFRNVKAQGSTWKKARLEDCTFEDCDLTRFDPTQLTAAGIAFRRSKLMGVDWSALGRHPTLEFDDCDLRYASFVKIGLRKTSFRGCRLAEATFVDSDLVESDFGDADLTAASFQSCDLTKANLSTAKGAFINPAQNRVKGARISLEAAVTFAASFGLRVAGFDE